MVLATSGIDLTMMYMITDGFLAAIMTPNMIGLIIMVPQVAKLQKEYFNTPGKYYLADKEAKKAFFENGDNCLISRTKYRGLLEALKK